MTNTQKEEVIFTEGNLLEEPILKVKLGEVMTLERINELSKGIQSLLDNQLSEQRAEILEMIEGMTSKGIEKVPEIMEKDRLYNLMNENMVIGYNQALTLLKDKILEIK